MTLVSRIIQLEPHKHLIGYIYAEAHYPCTGARTTISAVVSRHAFSRLCWYMSPLFVWMRVLGWRSPHLGVAHSASLLRYAPLVSFTVIRFWINLISRSSLLSSLDTTSHLCILWATPDSLGSLFSRVLTLYILRHRSLFTICRIAGRRT